MATKEFNTVYIMLGGDPEFFLKDKDGIIGSELFIPQNGMKLITDRTKELPNSANVRCENTFVKRDGVQVELNLSPQTCRGYLANEIANCFYTLYKSLENINISEEAVVKIKKKRLDALSEDSRKFGCAPSNNAYSKKENKIKVNPSKYLTRSAGGHIHFGQITSPIKNTRIKILKTDKYGYGEYTIENMQKDAEEIVMFLDTILATICVLIDRDPLATKRREVYGKAGDYRLPKHGIEYRTLSNFWLKHYFLFSLVFGLARTTIEIFLNDWSYYIVKDLLGKFDFQEIINNNDFNKAYKVWEILKKEIFSKIYTHDHFSIDSQTIPGFEKVIKNGYEHYLEINPLKHWALLPEAHYSGAKDWLLKVEKLPKEFSKWL